MFIVFLHNKEKFGVADKICEHDCDRRMEGPRTRTQGSPLSGSICRPQRKR